MGDTTEHCSCNAGLGAWEHEAHCECSLAEIAQATSDVYEPLREMVRRDGEEHWPLLARLLSDRDTLSAENTRLRKVGQYMSDVCSNAPHELVRDDSLAGWRDTFKACEREWDAIRPPRALTDRDTP